MKVNIIRLVFKDGSEDFHAIYDNREAEDFLNDMKNVKELKKMEWWIVKLLDSDKLFHWEVKE